MRTDRLEIVQKRTLVGGEEMFSIQWPIETKLGNDFLYTREEITRLVRAASLVLGRALERLEDGTL